MVLYKFKFQIGKDRYSTVATSLTEGKKIVLSFFNVPENAIQLKSQTVYKKFK